MGKGTAWRKAMGCFFPSEFVGASFKRCLRILEEEEGLDEKSLIDGARMLETGNVFDGKKTLDFHLQPKTIVLRVSMHCHGCARKVRKHLSKMEGVTSFDVDLENKRVVVVGSISPIEVLVNISKVKTAQLLTSPLGQPSQCLVPWAPSARAK